MDIKEANRLLKIILDNDSELRDASARNTVQDIIKAAKVEINMSVDEIDKLLATFMKATARINDDPDLKRIPEEFYPNGSREEFDKLIDSWRRKGLF
jgi:hypothetical protein